MTNNETTRELPPLRPDEQAKSYSKYYYRPIAPPNPRLMAILGQGPIDPAKALPFERLNDLLDSGYLEVETGYCILENGAGYVAVNNVFPGCTVDMMKWWFAWHAADGGLRYKIWFPPGHASIATDEADHAKLVDPAIPIGEKSQNVVHFVVENVGNGFEDIEICFLDPKTIGFDMSRFHTPNVAAVFGGFGISEARQGPPMKSPAIMVHFCREIEGGIEFRTLREDDSIRSPLLRRGEIDGKRHRPEGQRQTGCHDQASADFVQFDRAVAGHGPCLDAGQHHERDNRHRDDQRGQLLDDHSPASDGIGEQDVDRASGLFARREAAAKCDGETGQQRRQDEREQLDVEEARRR